MFPLWFEHLEGFSLNWKRIRAVFPPFFMCTSRTSIRVDLTSAVFYFGFTAAIAVLLVPHKLPRLARFRTATAGVFLCAVVLGEFPPMTKRI